MAPKLRSDAALRLKHAGHSVSEELGWWLRGRTSSGFLFEISFEDHNRVNRMRHLVAPDIPLTYLGLWDPEAPKRQSLVAEFQLGSWCHPPSPAIAPQLAEFLAPLRHCFPAYITPAAPSPSPEAFLASIGMKAL